MKNSTIKPQRATKKTSAKPAPKFRMKLEKPLGGNAEFAATAMLAELPTRLLASMGKAHQVPVAKYKDDMVERLARKLILELGRRVIVKIL
jgi:hypothetical protein